MGVLYSPVRGWPHYPLRLAGRAGAGVAQAAIAPW